MPQILLLVFSNFRAVTSCSEPKRAVPCRSSSFPLSTYVFWHIRVTCCAQILFRFVGSITGRIFKLPSSNVELRVGTWRSMQEHIIRSEHSPVLPYRNNKLRTKFYLCVRKNYFRNLKFSSGVIMFRTQTSSSVLEHARLAWHWRFLIYMRHELRTNRCVCVAVTSFRISFCLSANVRFLTGTSHFTQ